MPSVEILLDRPGNVANLEQSRTITRTGKLDLASCGGSVPIRPWKVRNIDSLRRRTDMAIYYTACRRFDPSHGDRWRSYLEWSGYHHLREVVSTDSLLCPALVHELTEEDWDYNVHQPERAHWFLDCEYLVRRIGYDPSIHNILAISEHPTRVSESIDDFDFCGFDILDSHESLSVLLNCGAFPSIFCAQDLNQYGLLDHLDRAAAIAQRLRDSHGTDSHCGNCSVWGVARYSRNAVAGRYSP